MNDKMDSLNSPQVETTAPSLWCTKTIRGTANKQMIITKLWILIDLPSNVELLSYLLDIQTPSNMQKHTLSCTYPLV